MNQEAATGQNDEKRLSLDQEEPRERKLFMTTDYEAQKRRFGQRMNCKFKLNCYTNYC